MRVKENIKYTYKNAPIPGGGYVTGLLFHKMQEGILYARTDIGGTYRFDYEKKKWISLINHVTSEDLSETYPIAIALDDKNPEKLFIISGVEKNGYGVLSISCDYGNTFTYKKVPTMVHGNLSGRGTGNRLVVDKNDSNTLYFASQKGGLLKTTDGGDTWERLPVKEDYMTFVWVSDDSKTIVVGTAGYTTRVDDSLRGHSLYVSYDAGNIFEELEEPKNIIVKNSKMNGLVASRYDYDGKYLYVTMNCTGRCNYIVDLGYSCDTGDVINGKVLRYSFKNGRIDGFCDITPDSAGGRTRKRLDYGFGGVSSCKAKPGLLVCSTLCKEKESPECIYISEDYGKNWRVSLGGLEEGGMYFRTSYMEPKYNANVSIVHWISDVKINPHNANELWFNSGTGVFTTDELLSDNPKYHDFCDGIEETVHLNVYAPKKGDIKLVDIVGDLGGFAFKELDKPCKNSFDDKDGNRYITCINADFASDDSEIAVISARGNWKGKTKGGLIKTTDDFKTFERINMPMNLGRKITNKLKEIERPNVNPGWVSMGADGKNIVWSIADGILLPVDMVIYSMDGGESFEKSKVYFSDKHKKTTGYFKTYSSKSKDSKLIGFDENGKIYLSVDGGKNFREKKIIAKDRFGNEIKPPINDFGYIDTANKTEVRFVKGNKILFYMALGENGLYKCSYSSSTSTFEYVRLTNEGENCYRVGVGIGKNGKLALYFNGVIEGTYGFYRTFDEGETFQRINDDNQMFGEINSIDADKNVFGRFFLGTGSRGVIYGEEA